MRANLEKGKVLKRQTEFYSLFVECGRFLRFARNNQKEGELKKMTEICSNCGATMLATYTRQGLKLYICPHNKATTKKNRLGMPIASYLPCQIDIGGMMQSFKTMTKGDITIEQLREATRNLLSDAALGCD